MARDAKTGQLGVAVQSHHFSVGSIVPWAKAGVGAVATQAQAEVSYGYLGLELMGAGKDARTALKALTIADANREARQVAMVDSRGTVAVHTGSRCVPLAGDFEGTDFSCQANFAKSKKVWQAMGKVYASSTDVSFPERLIRALEAGQEAGGDIRGQQSAAIMVVSGKADHENLSTKLVDLRVEDHLQPIKELKRLLQLRRATDWNHRAIGFLAAQKYEDAARAYEKAKELDRESIELEFWTSLCLVLSGKSQDKARARLFRVFQANPEWIQVTKGLGKVGLVKLSDSFFEDA